MRAWEEEQNHKDPARRMKVNKEEQQWRETEYCQRNWEEEQHQREWEEEQQRREAEERRQEERNRKSKRKYSSV